MRLGEYISEKFQSAQKKANDFVDNRKKQLDQLALKNGMETDKNALIGEINNILNKYHKSEAEYNKSIREYEDYKQRCKITGNSPWTSATGKMTGNPSWTSATGQKTNGMEQSLATKRNDVLHKKRSFDNIKNGMGTALNNCVKDRGYNNMTGFKEYLTKNYASLTKKDIQSYLDKNKFTYYYNWKRANELLAKGKITISPKELNTKVQSFQNLSTRNNKALSEDEIKHYLLNIDEAREKAEKAYNLLTTISQDAIDDESLQQKNNIEQKKIALIQKINSLSTTTPIKNLKNELGEDLYNTLIFTLNLDENKTIGMYGKTAIIDWLNAQFSNWYRNYLKNRYSEPKKKRSKKKPSENGNTSKDDSTSKDDNTDENTISMDDDNDEDIQYKTIYDILREIKDINYSNYEDLKNKISDIFTENEMDLNDKSIKSEISTTYGYIVKRHGEAAGEPTIMVYALACGITDINNRTDLNEFVETVQSIDRGENISSKYAEQYKKFLSYMGQYYEECIREIAIQSLIARYEAANAVADGRNFYESDFINFAASTADGRTQSGLQIASNIDNIDAKLNHYGFNSNKSEHEEAALRYTAFDITFKNTFNLSNPIIEKLGAQQIDLRSDLFSYGIYNQEDNFFNKDARDKYVAEKLQPIGLAPEEIEELLHSMEQLPSEVEKNYEILSGNFDADQDSFEKIAKIYALGEVIDNIKKLFTRSETLSDSQKLGDFMGLKLNENKPADVVGDYLLLNGTINGTSTKIKYNLRTGKLYMNALTQQEFNPPKITIGNDEPNTEIGDIGNFDDILEGYEPTSFTQTDELDDNQSSSTTDNNPDNQDSNDSDNGNSNESGTETQNQKVLEKLVENKLLDKLKVIGKTVQEKAGEQSKENVVIDNFLKTFNILPDEGNSDTIEFMGGSNLFVILESIKNTNDEDYLLKFSNLMSELMSFCGMSRGKNNLFPNENEFDSVTIFDIDEKNATQDIISLQRANKNFFSGTGSEKDKIKGYELHFDSSVQLSFANIIKDKCCRRYGDGWKISTKLAEEFVNSVKEGIDDIKKDENDLITVENIIDDDSMWA